MTGELVQFPSRPRRLSHEEGRAAAACVLATPISEREERASELYLDEPELLISLCELLTKQLETSPATVCEEAGFFYRFVSIPKRPIGLFDEREYFLGELALIAGTACRVLFRREEARRWFDVAETHVVLVANGTAHVARLAYQKLALAAEERRFEEVLKLAPVWSENFLQLGMPEDALKCRFLVGIALWEMGQLRESVEAFRGICGDAEKLQNVRLIAQAANNLAQLYAILGEADEALTCSRKALPLLKHLSSRVHLVKLQWGLGDLLRGQGNVAGAVEAYRAALKEAGEVGMRGDAAALHLVLADVLLGAGQDRQAEWEIRAALPIIEEEKMVPEGYAALSLLQESLRRRQIDQNALRNLHGYFRDPK